MPQPSQPFSFGNSSNLSTPVISRIFLLFTLFFKVFPHIIRISVVFNLKRNYTDKIFAWFRSTLAIFYLFLKYTIKPLNRATSVILLYILPCLLQLLSRTLLGLLETKSLLFQSTNSIVFVCIWNFT